MKEIPMIGRKPPTPPGPPAPHPGQQLPVIYVNGFAASTGGVDVEFALMLGEQYAMRLVMPLSVARTLGEACAGIVAQVEQATETTVLSSEVINTRMQNQRPPNN